MNSGIISETGYTVFDFFAGIGSMSLAARTAGFYVKGAYECYEKAGAVYKQNLNTDVYVSGDFHAEIFRDFPETDIFVGRLPVSIFKTAGTTVQNEKNWKALADMILERLPKAFLFVMSDKIGAEVLWKRTFYGNLWERYRISRQLVDACEMTGFPVYDRKIYIVGIRSDINDKFSFPPASGKKKENIKAFLQDKVTQDHYEYAAPYINSDMYCGADIFCWSENQYKPREKITYNWRKPALVLTEPGLRRISNREIARTKGLPDEFLLPEAQEWWNYRRLCDCVNVKAAAEILSCLSDALNGTAEVTKQEKKVRAREKIVGDKTAWEAAELEQTKLEQTVGDKIAWDKAAQEKTVGDKAARDKSVPLPEKAPDERGLDEIRAKVKAESLDRAPASSKEAGMPETKEKPSEQKPQKTRELRRIFLSYCHKDSDIADLIEERLTPLIRDEFRISRDIRDVRYRESFRKFMESIRSHEYVIMLISDHYIKSVNCMHEVTEVLKDSGFRKKILFIILGEEDKKYYKKEIQGKIAPEIYSVAGQGVYTIFWNEEKEKLEKTVDAIGDPTDAVPQLQEIKRINRIKLDLSDFFAYIADAKGLPLSEHLDNGFEDILRILKSGSEE